MFLVDYEELKAYLLTGFLRIYISLTLEVLLALYDSEVHSSEIIDES